MNSLERQVRALVIRKLAETSTAPSASDVAREIGTEERNVVSALRALANEHLLALIPATDAVWMAHPFSAVPTDFSVYIGSRRWFANCAWDGLSILAFFGDGVLETHSPASGEAIKLEVQNRRIFGEALIHFLVPARRFWDDIRFT